MHERADLVAVGLPLVQCRPRAFEVEPCHRRQPTGGERRTKLPLKRDAQPPDLFHGMDRAPTRAISISEELAKLPTQPVAALRILKMVDDPRASAAALGRLVEIDPGLSTKVMRLANAP